MMSYLNSTKLFCFCLSGFPLIYFCSRFLSFHQPSPGVFLTLAETPGNSNVSSGVAAAPTKKIDVYSSNFEDEWQKIIDQRTAKVKEICEKYHRVLFRTEAPILKHTKMPLAYCRSAKAGSSTWNSILIEMSGEMTSKDPHVEALRLFGRPNELIQKQDPEFVYFTVVRHPFVRLVSAYRDKVGERYKEDRLKLMVKQYRDSLLDAHKWRNISTKIGINVDNLPTFREFALNAADEVLQCYPSRSNSACLSFLDVHWRPFFDRCAFCNLRFDVISKMETFDQDASFILSKIYQKLPSKTAENGIIRRKLKKYIEKSKKRVSGNKKLKASEGKIPQMHKSSGLSSSQLTKQLFDLLSEEEKKKIFKAYFFDFVLFGYDPDVIL